MPDGCRLSFVISEAKENGTTISALELDKIFSLSTKTVDGLVHYDRYLFWEKENEASLTLE